MALSFGDTRLWHYQNPSLQHYGNPHVFGSHGPTISAIERNRRAKKPQYHGHIAHCSWSAGEWTAGTPPLILFVVLREYQNGSLRRRTAPVRRTCSNFACLRLRAIVIRAVAPSVPRRRRKLLRPNWGATFSTTHAKRSHPPPIYTSLGCLRCFFQTRDTPRAKEFLLRKVVLCHPERSEGSQKASRFFASLRMT